MSDLTPRQMRYELLTLILAIKPEQTSKKTIAEMNEYYDSIIDRDGEVVEFTLYADEYYED